MLATSIMMLFVWRAKPAEGTDQNIMIEWNRAPGSDFDQVFA